MFLERVKIVFFYKYVPACDEVRVANRRLSWAFPSQIAISSSEKKLCFIVRQPTEQLPGDRRLAADRAICNGKRNL